MAQMRTNGSVDETSADLAAQIAALKADVAALTATLADYGRARTAQFETSAQESLEMAKKMGAETAAQARQQARDVYAGAEKTVRANPAASVGIAAGLGFLAGLLSARR